MAPPNMVPCGICGAPIDPMRANYDKAGRQVCTQCDARGQIFEGDKRAVGSIVGSAIGVVLAGFVSVTCCNVFYIFSFVAFFGGIGWIVTVARTKTHRDQMGWKFPVCLIGVILAMLGGSIGLLILLLQVLGVVIDSPIAPKKF